MKLHSEINWQAQLTNGSFHLARLPSTKQSLHDKSLVNSVTYVWCSGDEKEIFTFGHFLSVRSVLFYLRPDVVHFYCDKLPHVDGRLYNTWFNELQQEFPNFNVHIESFSQMCNNVSIPQINFLEERLVEFGGFYINENIILLRQPPNDLIQEPISAAFTENGQLAFLSMLPTRGGHERLKQMLYSNTTNYTRTHCSDNLCVDHTATGVIYPKDLWCDTGALSTLAIQLLYGTDRVPKAAPHDHEVVPRIAHYVWFGGGEMEFFFFLSVLSCLYILDLQAVHIHGDQQLYGKYWDQLHLENRFHYIYRPIPETIYGSSLKYIEHKADVALLDIMVHYGGIHVDPDMIFIQKLNTIFWRYDAIAAPARTTANEPFPVLINWGVFLGRPNAPFWWLVQKAQRNFLAEEWNWNSARVLYKIYERNPHLLKITAYLQTMCYTDCVLREPHRSNNTSMNKWLRNVYALHFTERVPAGLSVESDVFRINGPFSYAAKRILMASGRTCEDRTCLNFVKKH